MVHATGVQIYTHFRGPTWQAIEGSQAVGTVVNHGSGRLLTNPVEALSMRLRHIAVHCRA